MSVTYSINAHVIDLNGVLQLSGANPGLLFFLFLFLSWRGCKNRRRVWRASPASLCDFMPFLIFKQSKISCLFFNIDMSKRKLSHP